ncbi:MAG: BamA/TamA family outer membrane protein [Chitinophagaceae bacterium]
MNAGNKFKLRLSSDTGIHKFNYNGYKYDKVGLTRGINDNNNDELFISLGYRILTHKWRKEPFAASHFLRVNYSLTQTSFSIEYKSIFTQLIGKADLVLFADYDQERNYHYTGLGNNTKLISPDKNFFRTRFREFLGSIGLERRIGAEHNLGIHVFYEGVKVLTDTGKFISPNPASFFDKDNFYGVKANYNFKKVNNKIFPSSGFAFGIDGGYTKNADMSDRSFVKGGLMIGFYVPVLPSLTLAIKAAGATLEGDAEFYQLPRLGGGSTMRGFRRYRFFGKSAFSNQNELQFNFNMRSCLLNGKVGLLGLLDNGRVWLPGETSDEWHVGVGGGLMIAPFNKISITGTYTKSKEEARFNVRIGSLF